MRGGWMGALHLGGDVDWAEREFGLGTHPDGRVRRRIEEMGRCWEKRPGTPLPEIFPDRASQVVAYRLLSNERMTVYDVLEGHREATVERCPHAGVVLMVQDTTMLNYDKVVDHRAEAFLLVKGLDGSEPERCLLLEVLGFAVNVLTLSAPFWGWIAG